jgi:hypothetical protein
MVLSFYFAYLKVVQHCRMPSSVIVVAPATFRWVRLWYKPYSLKLMGNLREICKTAIFLPFTNAHTVAGKLYRGNLFLSRVSDMIKIDFYNISKSRNVGNKGMEIRQQ